MGQKEERMEDRKDGRIRDEKGRMILGIQRGIKGIVKEEREGRKKRREIK